MPILPSNTATEPSTLGRTLLGAIARILRPLVRVLLRNGIASDAVTEMVRRIYVDVAHREFGLAGKRSTQSRVSVLTGLSRKEVARLLSQDGTLVPPAEDRRNRAATLLTAWLRDEDYLDDKGQPLALEFSGDGSFAELCKRYSGDMKPRTIADELMASGALVETNGKLVLTARGYVPGEDPEEIIRILGTDSSELIQTIDYNLRAPRGARRYQSKVLYDNVPAQHVEEFQRLSAQRAQALLEELDRWLADRDQGEESVEGEPRFTLGLSAFQIVAASPHGASHEGELTANDASEGADQGD